MAQPNPTSLGALRESGYRPRSVKDELRENTLAALRDRRPLFDGVVGYERTVEPEIVHAILSRHDFILLGLRGQAKTRLIRSLTPLLDEWLPALDGAPIPDDPFAPITPTGRRLVAEGGDDAAIRWIHRDERFFEKLATPDVTIADLIGDVDPIKAAHEGRSLDDEEIIQYGLVPRAHRGIFAINELPDLAPRIQVGLLNILEEKDVQIRNFPVRIPIDALLVFTANPEDYTNRGSIITPLKDRIDSQIHTHYPTSLDDAMRITEQEAWTARGDAPAIPNFLRRVVDEAVFLARESDYIDRGSGVSARAAISAYENLLSSLERRAAMHGIEQSPARVCDLSAVLPALTGKMELAYEGEEEGIRTVARDLVGKAVQRIFLEHFPDPKARTGRHEANALEGERSTSPEQIDHSVYGEIVGHFAAGNKVELSDTQSEAEYGAALDAVPGLRELVMQHIDPRESERHAWMECVLEGLYQSSFVAKEDLDRGTLYSDMLMRMFEGMGEA